MFARFIETQLQGQERKLGASLDHMRYILGQSWGVFVNLTQIARMANARRHCPPAAWHVAAISATRMHDCGACLQMAVNAALQAGLPKDIVAAAANDQAEALPEELRTVFHFAAKVAGERAYDEALRSAIEGRIGKKAFTELAFGLALAGVFPTLKRALGYAQSCSLIKIDI